MLGVDHEKVRVDPSQVVEVELAILLRFRLKPLKPSNGLKSDRKRSSLPSLPVNSWI
jgi:hypothetical protein